MAGAVFGDLGVSLFVAGAVFGEMWVDSRSAKGCHFQYKISANGRVRDDEFMLGSCSDHARIMFVSCSNRPRIGIFDDVGAKHLVMFFCQACRCGRPGAPATLSFHPVLIVFLCFEIRIPFLSRCGYVFCQACRYVANEICESACSRCPKNAEKSLGGVVAYVWVQGDREWKGESMTEDTL